MNNSIIMVISETAIATTAIMVAFVLGHYAYTRRRLGFLEDTNRMFLSFVTFCVGITLFVGGFIPWWAARVTGDTQIANAYIQHSAWWTVPGAVFVILGGISLVYLYMRRRFQTHWIKALLAVYATAGFSSFVAIKTWPLILRSLFG